VEYNEGTKGLADGIIEEFRQVKKHLRDITGVEHSQGTLTSLLVLPTGGGGFSTGNRVAIGAWWIAQAPICPSLPASERAKSG
jgi:hypothetical protein